MISNANSTAYIFIVNQFFLIIIGSCGFCGGIFTIKLLPLPSPNVENPRLLTPVRHTDLNVKMNGRRGAALPVFPCMTIDLFKNGRVINNFFKKAFKFFSVCPQVPILGIYPPGFPASMLMLVSRQHS